MQDNWVQPPPPQALRCLSVNSNAPDCEYTEQNLLWNKDSLSSAIWFLWFGDTDGGGEQKQFEERLAEELGFHMCLTMAQWLVQILSEQREHKVQNCMGRHWLQLQQQPAQREDI